MAKSVTGALIGVLVKDSILDINTKELIPEWSGDERSEISLENLMHMQSGLEWNEDYGNRSDVTVMLHCVPGFAEYAYSMPLEYEPGTHWYYSSGTTNIVSKIIRSHFNNDELYYAFPHKDLFYKIGITGAIFETDESGTLAGSSYLYMTARDYARFALLFMNDGFFNNNQILPEGWVDYVTTSVPDSKGEYGSFFWLNKDLSIESAPEDMYMCVGHDGQRIFLIPSLDLVVVILGYSPDHSMNFNQLLADIIDTL
jgi:CubicO group peptidase (beta-lactamase class C family)